VDCGGIWGRDIAAMAGQSVSLLAAEGLVNLTPYWRSESW